jgi:hypothetical protein
MKDRENELFNYLNQLEKDETSDTPLLFKANIIENKIELESLPLNSETKTKFETKYKTEEDYDLNLN